MTAQKEKKSFLDRLLLAAGIVFLIVFCVSGFALVQYYRAYRIQKNQDETIVRLREKELEENQENASEEQSGEGETVDWYEINPDYVGFLTIPDTNVCYPVVQRDNEYYLTHDFFGETSRHGAIFMDESCQADDSVVLIHGHHMKDGTMFGSLKSYKKKDFRENHDTLYLDWGEGEKAYRIFAVALIDLTREDYFTYEILPQTVEETEKYFRNFRQNSIWYQDVDVREEKQIILLSTCEYGTQQQRMVVAAILDE
jgi:sortase B